MPKDATGSGLRSTGVSVVGDMPWGTHFCHFYETKQDLLDILVPYFKPGLENKEFCLWVTSDPLTVAEATHALRQAVPDLDRHLAEQAIEILPYEDWDLDGGAFHPQRVIDGWHQKLQQALARGYIGMRVNGNEAWLKREIWKEFVDYEQEVNKSIAGQSPECGCPRP
ncbi:MAG: MEDS domain-containing protein [Candidatus Acidiferrales bacterium]